MMTSVREYYNEIYITQEAEFSLTYAYNNVDCVVERAFGFGLTGPVLDVGAGAGSESLYLASRGIRVDAIDVSDVAILKLQLLAKRHHLPLALGVADASDAPIAGPYNAVICAQVIQHLPQDTAERFLSKIDSATTSGGLHVLRVHGHSEHGRLLASEKTWTTYSKDQLRSYYSGWNILELQDFKYAMERNGRFYNASSLTLIARKR